MTSIRDAHSPLARRSRKADRVLEVWVAVGLAVGAAGCGFSEEDERLIGEYEAAQVDSGVPMVRDTAIVRFVSELGHSLAATSTRADLDWRFAVVNSSEVNAFALPGGFVYVTRGLIEAVDRYDQLAGVMGHEVAHVVLRHSVDQLEQEARRDVGRILLCTLTPACNTLGGVIAVDAGAEALTARYSQDDEAEADSLSVVLMLRVGIDPEGIPAFFEMLLAQRTEQPTPIDAFFATHPTDEARIRAVRRQIAALDGLPEGLLRDSPELDSIQARLLAMPPPPAYE